MEESVTLPGAGLDFESPLATEAWCDDVVAELVRDFAQTTYLRGEVLKSEIRQLITSLLDVGLPLGFYAVLAVLVTLVVVGAVISTRRRAAGRAIVGLGAAGLVVSAVLAAASIGLFLLPIVGLAVATFVATGRDRGPAG